ncbi:16S rRNA (guanine(527)-N(7))-methyltransferase RsmG [Fodinisporobacter ferrooxydans]|uniref:Ribosomal RNA small subunit methyltransferase G n=2 Tax=Fodinisporobacter ferrooxydans TaxID=2901836 RepID=A0ABY4CQL4_9BACL|nr:16S rRNA (guanine(527)-N(7))-methyltransferase RsmG [Alicyclobacillaceae bacterium MYW30-H2]
MVQQQTLEPQFQEWCEGLSLSLGSDQLRQFFSYYQMLIAWNERMNLTALTEVLDVYLKHFYDSLTLASAPSLQTRGSLLDIGAGAGFPSIPLRIVYPELQVTILDSLQKRIQFLGELILGLRISNNVSAVHGRAEDFGRRPAWRESFDQVTARAVARLPVLAEYCLPFVKVNGCFLALKGLEGEEEAREGKSAVHQLGGEIEQVIPVDLPLQAGKRCILVIRKVKQCPKSFPRKAGVPQKRPLV